jgi:hypothetical protein
MTKMPEWKQYAVGEPSTRSDRTEQDCRPFDTVYHICHIEDAFRIFQDGEIRPSPIFTTSKMRNTRTNVIWLSPNTWASGSPYGNVCFAFDWNKLIDGRRFYWVEAFKFQFTALRFLVTEESPTTSLQRYRPQKDKGPVFHDMDKDIWYRNGKYTCQFMFDGVLPISDCKRVTFVDHHPTSCNKVERCASIGKSGDRCGAHLLSRLIAQPILRRNSKRLVRLFCEPKQKGAGRGKRLHFDARQAWKRIIKLSSEGSGGRITRSHRAAFSLASAILDRFGSYRATSTLRNLFKNSEELRWAITERARKAFGNRIV